MAAITNHPYLPRDMVLPNYVENDRSLIVILGGFFGFMTVLWIATWIHTGHRSHLTWSLGDRLKMCWFTSCAVIHTVLEGYFSLYYATFPSQQSLLAQMWKEYSKGDSRYVSGDTFMVCMESITAAVDGPLCLVAFLAFSYNKPYRYVIQLVVSLCQLYGDLLYFMTEWKDGFIHGEIYHPLYFWFYFVFLNSVWILIPTACIIEACVKLSGAQQQADKGRHSKKK